MLPDVGSISTVSGLMTPAFSIAMIMAEPMRSFTLPAGLKYSSLARMSPSRRALCGKRCRAHERRIADGIHDRIVNLAASWRARLGGR